MSDRKAEISRKSKETHIAASVNIDGKGETNIKTNIGFLTRIITAKAFAKGDYHTHFIDEHEAQLLPKFKHQSVALISAALISLAGRRKHLSGESTAGPQTTPWQEIGRWELSGK